MASTRQSRSSAPRVNIPPTGSATASNTSANTLRPNRLRAWVIALDVGTDHDASQHPPPVKRPGDLGRDLLVVIVAEQAQRHRQVRRDMCRQLPTRTPVADPTSRDRGVDRVPRHRADQHTQRHLIR
jgi:hypothetical protein